MKSFIAGVGGYLPEKIISNDDLAKTLDTSDEWIKSRSGIEQRHIAADSQLTSDLGAMAAKDALIDAGLEAKDIDLVIVGTTTPDYIFPATAAIIQHKLGIPPCCSFDVQAVCSGFLYALMTADMYIRQGQAKNALVIGAETLSRIVDWNDRSTCVLFGDGAGAFVLKAVEDDATSYIVGTKLFADGQFREALHTEGGASLGHFGPLKMNGKEVFKHAVNNMASSIEALFQQHHLSKEDIDLLVPHQANLRIIEMLAEKLHVPLEKVITTIQKQANTSAASIPLAFNEAKQNGLLKRGMKVIAPAMGGGFTWGASYLIW
jgi:3-oxoacyl-[acyl-carrier-protein] synthase-3